MSTPRRRIVVAAVAGAGLVLAALVATVERDSSGPDRAAAPSSAPPVTVVVPGRPGESPTKVSSADLTAPDGSAYNLLDATFMRMMIPHHAQALEMATLAPGRATHPQVLAVAARIRAAQQPEMAVMSGWLTARGLAVDDPVAGHDHATMAGMQTPEAIAALRAATGDAFDRLFVDLMAAHHEGAVRMAVDVLAVCRNGQVEEMANAIATEQGIEIERMREALAAPR